MEDFIRYAKEFLKFKLLTADKKNVKDTFNLLVLEQDLISSRIKTIDNLHTQCNVIASKGLKQLQTPSNALKNFYTHLEKNKNTLEDVETSYIDDYINKTCVDNKLGKGTRTNYKNNVTAFFTYIDNNYERDNKFNISQIKVLAGNDKKSTLKDWIDTPTIVKANQRILNYPFNNNLDKSRDILIFKLFIFSGILPNEMAALTEDNFIFEDELMVLKINGIGARKRMIPLPKGKLFIYYNQYMKLRDSNAKTFFYSPTDGHKTKINTQYLNTIVKKLLVFTKITVKNKTPSLLRKSWMILLHNEKDINTGLTQTVENIQYLSGIANLSQVKEILKYNTIETIIISNIFDNLDI